MSYYISLLLYINLALSSLQTAESLKCHGESGGGEGRKPNGKETITLTSKSLNVHHKEQSLLEKQKNWRIGREKEKEQ
jgi:hypothetical protein